MRDIKPPQRITKPASIDRPQVLQPVPVIPTYAPYIAAPQPKSRWQLAFIPAAILAIIAGGGIGYTAAQFKATPVVATAKPVASMAATASEPAARVTAAKLQSTLDGALAGLPASASASIIDLTNGTTAGHNANQQMVSASLYKLFVALAVYRQIDSGAMTLASGAGNGQTVGACLDKMITVSDNSCGVALGSLVGWSKQNSAFQKDGFAQTRLSSTSDELTSAADVALLLKRLQAGSLLSPVSTTHFTDLLKAQRINNRLPVGLPNGVAIGHKTGDLGSLVHDAGIVYAPKGEYVIVMMTDGWSSVTDAPAAFSKVSRSVYTAFTEAK